MAIQKNYRQIKFPAQWVSAYQPIRYTFDVPTENGTFTDNLGFVQVDGGVFRNSDTLLQVGDLIYITVGVYKGYHTVKEVIGYSYLFGSPILVTYTLNTSFTTNDGGASREIKYMQPPLFYVYKGYQDSEVIGTNPYPYVQAASFLPEGNLNGFLEFNISGYVQSCLKEIVPPQQGTLLAPNIYEDNGYNLYIPFRVVFGGAFNSVHFGLCAGIESEELFSKYVSTRQYLAESIVFGECQSKFATYISGSKLRTYRVVGSEVLPRRAFNDRFNSRFLNT